MQVLSVILNLKQTELLHVISFHLNQSKSEESRLKRVLFSFSCVSLGSILLCSSILLFLPSYLNLTLTKTLHLAAPQSVRRRTVTTQI